MQNEQKETEDNPLLDIFDLCDVASVYVENSKVEANNRSVNERDRSPTVRVRQEFIHIQPTIPKKLTILSSDIFNYNYPIAKPECIECVEEKRRLAKITYSQRLKEQLPFHPTYHPIVPYIPPANHLILNSGPNINVPTKIPQETQMPSQIPLQSTSSQNINLLYQNNFFNPSIPPFLSQQFRPKELNKDNPLVQLLIQYYNNNTSIQCQKCNNMTFIGYLFKLVNEKDNTEEFVCFNCCLDENIITAGNIMRLKPYISIDNNSLQFNNNNNSINNNNNNNKINLINCFYCKNGYHPICYIRYLSYHYTLSQICLLCNLKIRRCNSNIQAQMMQQKPTAILATTTNNNQQSQLCNVSQQESKDMKNEKIKDEVKDEGKMKEEEVIKEEKDVKEIPQQQLNERDNLKEEISQSEKLPDKCNDISDEKQQQIVMNEVELIKLKEERLKRKSQILKKKRFNKKKE